MSSDLLSNGFFHFQKNGPANTLEYLVRDVVHRMTKSHRYTLIEIGLVINNLMGNGFRYVNLFLDFFLPLCSLEPSPQIPEIWTRIAVFERSNLEEL